MLDVEKKRTGGLSAARSRKPLPTRERFDSGLTQEDLLIPGLAQEHDVRAALW
jgi:hypothetical protein